MARYKYNDDLPYIVVERRDSGATILPFLWGALIGAGLALLYAPRSGEETRAEIQGGVRRLRRSAEDAVRGVQNSVAEAVEGVRTTVTGRVSNVRDAVDAGKSAARESRADMERRIREARAGFESGARSARSGRGYSEEEDLSDDDV